jgi:hypothetical protein
MGALATVLAVVVCCTMLSSLLLQERSAAGGEGHALLQKISSSALVRKIRNLEQDIAQEEVLENVQKTEQSVDLHNVRNILKQHFAKKKLPQLVQERSMEKAQERERLALQDAEKFFQPTPTHHAARRRETLPPRAMILIHDFESDDDYDAHHPMHGGSHHHHSSHGHSHHHGHEHDSHHTMHHFSEYVPPEPEHAPENHEPAMVQVVKLAVSLEITKIDFSADKQRAFSEAIAAAAGAKPDDVRIDRIKTGTSASVVVDTTVKAVKAADAQSLTADKINGELGKVGLPKATLIQGPTIQDGEEDSEDEDEGLEGDKIEVEGHHNNIALTDGTARATTVLDPACLCCGNYTCSCCGSVPNGCGCCGQVGCGCCAQAVPEVARRRETLAPRTRVQLHDILGDQLDDEEEDMTHHHHTHALHRIHDHVHHITWDNEHEDHSVEHEQHNEHEPEQHNERAYDEHVHSEYEDEGDEGDGDKIEVEGHHNNIALSEGTARSRTTIPMIDPTCLCCGNDACSCCGSAPNGCGCCGQVGCGCCAITLEQHDRGGGNTDQVFHLAHVV